MTRRPGSFVALLGLGAAACNGPPTPADTPALIARATPESRAEILSVLETALGPREIRLAPDALTESSILALEQGEPGSPARGRVLDLPERFELVLSGGRCYLIRSATRDRYRLEQTDCIAAEP
jgi:hypothetical protein